ncbi:hypothetical protein BB561_003876 [Smittium simulii]|uniref:Uncharacterized protein n=1 Tax=Smittium simulii TaxID=133385 RepID=A0A2T9YJ32_9FUNG|nr:hypothetical protein BB561_003876 [Smittium simulii]
METNNKKFFSDISFTATAKKPKFPTKLISKLNIKFNKSASSSQDNRIESSPGFEFVDYPSPYHPTFSHKNLKQSHAYNYPQTNTQNQTYNYPQSSTQNQTYNYPQSSTQNQTYNYPQSSTQNQTYNYPQSSTQNQTYNYPQSSTQNQTYNYPQSSTQNQTYNYPQSSTKTYNYPQSSTQNNFYHYKSEKNLQNTPQTAHLNSSLNKIPLNQASVTKDKNSANDYNYFKSAKLAPNSLSIRKTIASRSVSQNSYFNASLNLPHINDSNTHSNNLAHYKNDSNFMYDYSNPDPTNDLPSLNADTDINAKKCLHNYQDSPTFQQTIKSTPVNRPRSQKIDFSENNPSSLFITPSPTINSNQETIYYNYLNAKNKFNLSPFTQSIDSISTVEQNSAGSNQNFILNKKNLHLDLNNSIRPKYNQISSTNADLDKDEYNPPYTSYYTPLPMRIENDLTPNTPLLNNKFDSFKTESPNRVSLSFNNLNDSKKIIPDATKFLKSNDSLLNDNQSEQLRISKISKSHNKPSFGSLEANVSTFVPFQKDRTLINTNNQSLEFQDLQNKLEYSFLYSGSSPIDSNNIIADSSNFVQENKSKYQNNTGNSDKINTDSSNFELDITSKYQNNTGNSDKINTDSSNFELDITSKYQNNTSNSNVDSKSVYSSIDFDIDTTPKKCFKKNNRVKRIVYGALCENGQKNNNITPKINIQVNTIVSTPSDGPNRFCKTPEPNRNSKGYTSPDKKNFSSFRSSRSSSKSSDSVSSLSNSTLSQKLSKFYIQPIIEENVPLPRLKPKNYEKNNCNTLNDIDYKLVNKTRAYTSTKASQSETPIPQTRNYSKTTTLNYLGSALKTNTTLQDFDSQFNLNDNTQNKNSGRLYSTLTTVSPAKHIYNSHKKNSIVIENLLQTPKSADSINRKSHKKMDYRQFPGLRNLSQEFYTHSYSNFSLLEDIYNPALDSDSSISSSSSFLRQDNNSPNFNPKSISSPKRNQKINKRSKEKTNSPQTIPTELSTNNDFLWYNNMESTKKNQLQENLSLIFGQSSSENRNSTNTLKINSLECKTNLSPVILKSEPSNTPTTPTPRSKSNSQTKDQYFPELNLLNDFSFSQELDQRIELNFQKDILKLSRSEYKQDSNTIDQSINTNNDYADRSLSPMSFELKSSKSPVNMNPNYLRPSVYAKFNLGNFLQKTVATVSSPNLNVIENQSKLPKKQLQLNNKSLVIQTTHKAPTLVEF